MESLKEEDEGQTKLGEGEKVEQDTGGKDMKEGGNYGKGKTRVNIEGEDHHYISLLREEDVGSDKEEPLYEMLERPESSIKGSTMGSMTGSDLEALSKALHRGGMGSRAFGCQQQHLD